MQNAEYLVVLDVLRRPRGRDRERMYKALRTSSPDELDTAIASLEQAGIVSVKGKQIHASPALRRLNELKLIGV